MLSSSSSMAAGTVPTEGRRQHARQHAPACSQAPLGQSCCCCKFCQGKYIMPSEIIWFRRKRMMSKLTRIHLPSYSRRVRYQAFVRMLPSHGTFCSIPVAPPAGRSDRRWLFFWYFVNAGFKLIHLSLAPPPTFTLMHPTSSFFLKKAVLPVVGEEAADRVPDLRQHCRFDTPVADFFRGNRHRPGGGGTDGA